MTFKEFYLHWYSRMKSFAREYVISEDDAEDIVQDVFTEIYNKYDSLHFNTNLVAYIFTMIKNRCIDLLRRRIIHQESVNHLREEYLLSLKMKFDSLEFFNDDHLKMEDIEQILENALQSLPDRCREIFIKHKIEGKKQKEIAIELDISPKTVDNQITIAYKKLREQLKKYPPLLLILL